jgi:hypothetical protein
MKISNDLACFGCGHPHPWSKKEGGKWVIICPNASKPSVMECTKLEILKFQSRKKKQACENKECKNVNTLNWEDIPQASHEQILLQQRALSLVSATDANSVSSSITGATGIKQHGSITVMQDIEVLASNTTKPPIPIAIHSPIAHLTIQTGSSNEEKDCPNLKCVFNSGAALSTANFHFMEAVIWQFPHILKKIYLPDSYAAIVLSGVVNSLTPMVAYMQPSF